MQRRDHRGWAWGADLRNVIIHHQHKKLKWSTAQIHHATGLPRRTINEYKRRYNLTNTIYTATELGNGDQRGKARLLSV